jgi:uncharacterized protein (TIGR04552 family)
MTRSVTPIHPSAEIVPLGRFDLHDLDTMRLLLRGGSVVDWYRLHFKERSEIDAFLRVNEIDANNPADQRRLHEVHRRAIEYLQEHLRYRVPDNIGKCEDVRVLFEFASGTKGRRRDRFFACLTLKVMHIVQHLDSHELLTMLPISHAEIAVLMQAKIERVVRGLLERSFPIVEFTGNTKAPYSVLTKLLAKKDTHAAQLFDKLRFRFVVERLEDIPPTLLALTRELMPFNYLVPNQAENTLVDVDRLLTRSGNLAAIRAMQEEDPDLNEEPTTEVSGIKKNEFSGPDYQVVNFVADVPLRLDRVLSFKNPRLAALGGIVFVLVEFQCVDRMTADANEIGENKHSLYKQRQRGKVKERLERGKRRKIQPPPLLLPPFGHIPGEDELHSEGPATAEELGADGREALR